MSGTSRRAGLLDSLTLFRELDSVPTLSNHQHLRGFGPWRLERRRGAQRAAPYTIKQPTQDRYVDHQFAAGTLIIDNQLTDDLHRGLRAELTPFVPGNDTYTRMNYRRALQAIESNPHTFDGPLAGVSSRRPGVLGFHAGRYRDYLALDMVDADGRRPFDQSALALLPDYGETALFGAAGVSVLAITSDNHVVLVEQTAANSHFARRWGPTGSGSLEPSDIEVGADPLSFLAKAAAREAREESGLHLRPAGLEFRAAGRWWEKASKPEFYFAVPLTLSSHEIQSEPAGEVYSGRVLPVPIDELGQLENASAGLLFTATACGLIEAPTSQVV